MVGACGVKRIGGARALLVALTLCLSCAADPAPKTRAEPATWTLVLQDLPAALLSVSGRSPEDVWAVGALLDDNAPLVLHYDGDSWQRVRVPGDAELWWLQLFEDTIYMGGAHGTILRGDGKTFGALPTPDPAAIVYGIWGTTPDSTWAVGTDGTNGVVWRSHGASFEAVDIDATLLAHTTLFKVWGRADDDVWMVGDQGRILHFDGEQFSAISSGTDVPLVTVHGGDSALYAVGGLGGSVILELGPEGVSDVTPPDAPAVNGVYVREEDVYVVGVFGEVLKRARNGAFERVETGLDLAREYHAVWVDQKHGVWAVGGHVSDAPLVQGLLSYSGAETPSLRVPSL